MASSATRHLSSTIRGISASVRTRSSGGVTIRKLSTTLASNETPVQPKRPSPYRLLTPTTFLASFAPLHVQGWRLIALDASKEGVAPAHHGDLQDRQLTRVYEFTSGKDGWTSLMTFSRKVLQEAALQDHHPSIHISPSSDWTGNGAEVSLAADTGYVLQVSTHTHTPLPPLGQPKDASKPRPGVTTKDIRLAEKLEEVLEDWA